MTMLTFDSMESVHAFGGDHTEASVVLPEAQAILTRYDERVAHFEGRLDVG